MSSPAPSPSSGQAKAADVLQMQTIVVDLDAGDIGAKLDHLVQHLGDPTLVVESGGRTVEGATKLHVWWKLNEPAEGEDLATLCRLRGDIAIKVGGDTHFRSAHQPIRVAGTRLPQGRLPAARRDPPPPCACRGRSRRIRRGGPSHARHAGRRHGARPARAEKPSIADVLTTPVREAGEDAWTRFEGASAAIGHYIRLVHDGRLSPNDGWEAICQYNAAMLRPAWPLERLKLEADRLWRRHVERNGPALLRNETPAVGRPYRPSRSARCSMTTARCPRTSSRRAC